MRSITGEVSSAPVGDAEPDVVRGGGGWRGLAWLTWRQHRWLVAITALAVLAEAAAMLATSRAIRSHSPCPENSACVAQLSRYTSLAELQIALVVILPGLVAAFWGAPLVAQEYEQRTHLLVWAQDITPRRWLVAKVVLMGALALILAVALGAAAQHLAHALNAAMPPDGYGDPRSMFESRYFEASPTVVAAYTFCGFALGAAAGAVSRRTVPAMGATIAVFTGFRLLTLSFLRPHYLPAKTALGPLDEPPKTGPDALDLVNSVYFADANGHPAREPLRCVGIASEASESPVPWQRCMRGHGITHTFLTYQPGSRIPVFQLIEAGIFVALAVVFLGVAWYRVRRI